MTFAMLFSRDLHGFLSRQTVHALPVHFPTVGYHLWLNPQHPETGISLAVGQWNGVNRRIPTMAHSRRRGGLGADLLAGRPSMVGPDR